MRPGTVAKALAGRLIVVCGPGGVGKTTVSAALALAGASSGRRTLVCTIDPSTRLRTSLGVKRLSGRPQRVRGDLYAMRLDPKQTFDDLVQRHAASKEARDRILSNRFYQQISSHLAGTHDVMAMEALLDVADEFDLVVLDTPPASSAIAFLDAPRKVLDFVDGRVLRYFLKPYFIAGRLAIEPRTIIGRSLLKALDATVGVQFLKDLSEFFLAFEGLFDSFRRTATAWDSRLKDPGTSILLVIAPSVSRVEEGASFSRALRERSLKPRVVIANRVHPWALKNSIPAFVSKKFSEPVALELVTLAKRGAARARRESRLLKVAAKASGVPVLAVPELDSDVHDLRALQVVADLIRDAKEVG